MQKISCQLIGEKIYHTFLYLSLVLYSNINLNIDYKDPTREISANVS